MSKFQLENIEHRLFTTLLGLSFGGGFTLGAFFTLIVISHP